MYDINGAAVGMKLAQQRLYHKENGKRKPLCLACGEKATNDLPTCGSEKCNKLVRPVYRWAKRVANLTLTKAVRVRRAA